MDDPNTFSPAPLRDGVTTAGGDRNWPMQCWWVAAHASEVGEAPISRWILEMPIAIYRKTDGEPVALHDRCPHRWAPLSMGKVEGDDLVCSYHGMQFAASGQCVKVPTQERTPTAIRIRAYPVIERYGFVWIWTGDVEKADPALIPDELAYLDDPDWHTVWGYKAVEGNYMQLKENVLDLTHFAFLHRESLGIAGWEQAPSVEVTSDRVTFGLRFEHAPLAPIYALPAGKAVGALADRHEWWMHLTAAAHHGGTDLHDPDAGENGLEHFRQRFVHVTTPVLVGKSHYYWAFARDHGDPFDVEEARAFAGIIFDEDFGVIEATQAMARRAVDQDDAVEFSVAADRPAIEGRRIVARQVAAERAAVAARP